VNIARKKFVLAQCGVLLRRCRNTYTFVLAVEETALGGNLCCNLSRPLNLI